MACGCYILLYVDYFTFQNSNLVLQADTRLIEKRARDENDGTVASLVGKTSGTRMGDKYVRSKPTSHKDGDDKKKKKKPSYGAETKISEYGSISASLLADDTGDLGIVYTPKTPQSREAYEVLLKFIASKLGDQPRTILCGAADEILEVLKDESITDKVRKSTLAGYLEKLDDDEFHDLLGVSKQINDYRLDQTFTSDAAFDETGVCLQFEGDESEEEETVKVVEDFDDGENEEGDDTEAGPSLHANLDKESEKPGLPGKVGEKLHPRDIDAYWLQRRLNKMYDDPVIAQGKAAEVLEILKTAVDGREVEDRLIHLLGYDQFDLIRLLRGNGQMILYCTLLKSAQSSSEKAKIREKMSADSELVRYLRMLESTDEKGDDHEKNIKYPLKDSVVAMDLDEESPVSKLEVLDLEDLAFAQGSHFMANKRCELPKGSFRKTRKGYEEIHVPALPPKPYDSNEVSYQIFILHTSHSLPQFIDCNQIIGKFHEGDEF